MKRTLIFSGQGSQYVGMGKDLCETYTQARDTFAAADDILGYSISSICFDGPADTLKETRYTQPALFVHELAIINTLESNVPFDAVAGHSLGEYSALVAAGVLSFTDALRLVKLRGELMFKAGESQPGTMAAIIGLDDAVVEEICSSLRDGVIVAANFNSPGQVVISGDAVYLRAHLDAFKQAGARMVTELPVSGAFHSPLMKPAQEQLAEAIHATQFYDAVCDVYCNVTGAPERSAAMLRENLIAQLVSPVRWTQTLTSMHANGIDTYMEIGPKNVLQGLVKRTLTGVNISGIDTAAQLALALQ
ncbi:MAG: ACP S-malonyltransferase [Candidatus Kapabacteria bacterium]|nr:ACP S-malonyltransferase [Candidatus Kapabacteria bacterium]